MCALKAISPDACAWDPFQMIGKQWMLITAKKGDKINTMTASWGGLGIMWNKPVAFLFVRPTRYTYSFLEESDTVSLNFLPAQYKDALNFCGRESGRDVDKIEKCGFHVSFRDNIPYFEESEIVMLCKTHYGQLMNAESFKDSHFGESNYPDKNFHKMYIAELQAVLKND